MLQVDLAKNVGVTQALICQIEKGIKMPSMVTGNLIAKELGCEAVMISMSEEMTGR